MKIGRLQLNNPFVLAPLAGITDAPVRLLSSEKGASAVYSEMVSCKGLYYRDENTKRLLATLEGEAPIFYQLFGSDPDMLEFATEHLYDRENAGFDINMGCPVPKVVKNGEGSALMQTPELASEVIVAAVLGARAGAQKLAGRFESIKPVTVKMRLGFDSEHINVMDIARRAERAGASAITIHGRTRAQYYEGKANWDIIRNVRENITIPVIANGDIFSGEDALAIMAHTGCDGAMIARGALGNPWIFREANLLWEELGCPDGAKLFDMGEERVRSLCREILAEKRNCLSSEDEDGWALPGLEEKKTMMLRHFEMSLEFKGEYAAVREMRKHVGWYLKGEHGAAALRRRVNEITDAQVLKAVIREI